MGISSSLNVEIERNINRFRETLRKFHVWEGKHLVLEKNINMSEFSMKMKHKKQGAGRGVVSLLQHMTL